MNSLDFFKFSDSFTILIISDISPLICHFTFIRFCLAFDEFDDFLIISKILSILKFATTKPTSMWALSFDWFKL